MALYQLRRKHRRVDGTDFERLTWDARVPGGYRLTVAHHRGHDEYGPTFHLYKFATYRFGRIDEIVVPREAADLVRRPKDPVDPRRLGRLRLVAAASRTADRAIVRANPACPAESYEQFTLLEWLLLWATEDDDLTLLRKAGIDPIAVLDMDELPDIDNNEEDT